MTDISLDELAFFDAKREALPLYLALRERLLKVRPDTRIEVRKTQISFKNRRLFAAVSFLPARRAALRPQNFLTLSLCLREPISSPRVDGSVETYPGRWTQHILMDASQTPDEELVAWLLRASDEANARPGKTPGTEA